MSAQESSQNRQLTLPEAVIWNGRRIEKLEVVVKNQMDNSNSVKESVELRTRYANLEEKFSQLSVVVARLEERMEEQQKVSLDVSEVNSESE